MLRKAILAFAAGAILVGAAAASVPTKTTSASGHYGYKAYIKPVYNKGAVAKNCLDNHGECVLVVR